MDIDDVDRRLLNAIQSDFPVCQRPFARIGGQVGLEEQDVLDRIRRLKAAGIIRRIGGNFAPDKLGYVSTLCAARVPAEKLDLFARVVNEYPGVTHNYVRDNDFNVWFTFISPAMEKIEEHLTEIRKKTGVDTVISLPATRVFKIKAEFIL